MTVGIIVEWRNDEGWGVIESPETPGGCWVFYSHLWADEMPKPRPGESLLISGGFRYAIPGETVDFDFEPVSDQDGYTFRATNVRPRREGPAWKVERPQRGSDSEGGIHITVRHRKD